MSKRPSSFTRPISPPVPPRRKARLDPLREPSTSNKAPNTPQINASAGTCNTKSNSPSLAAIEAGEAKIDDHLSYFSQRLAAVSRCEPSAPRLSIDEFAELYCRNDNPNGRHFVVHQHDHPVSGPHYDLRLQFSETSSVSFALPYGLPGNPHSKKPTRMALETRVHCLWNHIIETASHATGSLLIWDTGEYEVLDRPTPTAGEETDSSTSSFDGSENAHAESTQQPQNERLINAFQKSRITLRLHGTRLPPNYTINMWLPSANRDPHGKKNPKSRPIRQRRGKHIPHQHTSTRAPASARRPPAPSTDPDSLDSSDADPGTSLRTSVDQEGQDVDEGKLAAAEDDEDDHDEAAAIRAANAYTGSSNSIGSVHSRQWYVALNKELCDGFRSRVAVPTNSSSSSSSSSSFFCSAGKGRNDDDDDDNDDGRDAGGASNTFVVRGPAVECSVVTGRLAADVMADEGVVGFVPRRGWRPILH